MGELERPTATCPPLGLIVREQTCVSMAGPDRMVEKGGGDTKEKQMLAPRSGNGRKATKTAAVCHMKMEEGPAMFSESCLCLRVGLSRNLNVSLLRGNFLPERLPHPLGIQAKRKNLAIIINCLFP